MILNISWRNHYYFKDFVFSGHEVIKYKSKKDEFSIQLSGIVEDGLVKQVLDIYNKKFVLKFFIFCFNSKISKYFDFRYIFFNI